VGRGVPRLISEADNACFQIAVVASGASRVSQAGVIYEIKVAA
jgi:hypothetical protein